MANNGMRYQEIMGVYIFFIVSFKPVEHLIKEKTK